MTDNCEAPLLFDTPAPGVSRVTFNRPDAYNAFTFDMYQTMIDWLRKVQYDTDTRVVVLTGAGKGFCSGQDLTAGSPPPWAPEGVGPQHRDLYAMQEIRQLPLTLRALPQPVIAAVNGPTAGFGMTFVLGADMAIAGQSAKFVNAFHNVGIGSEGGMSYLLPRAVGTQRAAELLFTGRAVPATEAAEIGLVLKCVPDDDLMDNVLELASSIIVNTPFDNWLTKQTYYANLDAPSYAHALDLDTRGVILARTIADTSERRAAGAEGRPARYNHQ